MAWMLWQGARGAARTTKTSSATLFDKLWRYVGPWPSGKTEYEGDPLAARGGVYASLGGGVSPGYSEHMTYGALRWMETLSDDGGRVALGHDHVDFRSLVSNPPKGGSQASCTCSTTSPER